MYNKSFFNGHIDTCSGDLENEENFSTHSKCVSFKENYILVATFGATNNFKRHTMLFLRGYDLTLEKGWFITKYYVLFYC